MGQDQQELMFKLSMFEQQIQQLQQQLQAVDQGILDLSTLSAGLDVMEGSKGKEIFAPIGRGIFAKAKLLSEDLTVDVGGKNFVKKSIPDTKKIITDQITKLDEVKHELNSNLEKVSGDVTSLIHQAQDQDQEAKVKKKEKK